jgi:hypothetical protein
MRILIDSLGLQARIHARDGKRLETLLRKLGSRPEWATRFSPAAPLCSEALNACDVLAITTRKKQDADYTAAELLAIQDFVRRGGGLLLLSNHGDIPGKPYPDLTASDAVLARSFGIEIENSFFASPTWKQPVEIRATHLCTDHPVIRGQVAADSVRAIVTINCCSIKPGASTPLVFLPETMMDYRDGRKPQSRCFAVALEPGGPGAPGRVVITADSGFIGSDGTTYPGTGLIDRGDNGRFVANALRWLGGV